MVHEESKTYTCEYCENIFGTEWLMRQHISTMHENIKPFKCDFCDKHFRIKKYLQYHLEKVHIMPQSEVSNFFARANRNGSSYKSDAESKSKNNEIVEKSKRKDHHACKFCGKGFVMKIALKKHLEKNHQKTFVDNFLNK